MIREVIIFEQFASQSKNLTFDVMNSGVLPPYHINVFSRLYFLLRCPEFVDHARSSIAPITTMATVDSLIPGNAEISRERQNENH